MNSACCALQLQSACEQAPARYTSMRLSAIQSETAWTSAKRRQTSFRGLQERQHHTWGQKHQGGVRDLTSGLPQRRAGLCNARRRKRGPAYSARGRRSNPAAVSAALFFIAARYTVPGASKHHASRFVHPSITFQAMFHQTSLGSSSCAVGLDSRQWTD